MGLEAVESPGHTMRDYTPETYTKLSAYQADMVPRIPWGYSLNHVGKEMPELFNAVCARKWRDRMSNIPFGMHCATRLHPDRPSPTLSSACTHFLHPHFNRPITVREAATIMGWDFTPLGDFPYWQVAKGIVPEIGTWLAEMFVHCLDDNWGTDDFESSYDDVRGEWVGQNTPNAIEKTFDLTRYYYENENRQQHRSTVLDSR